jgi:hypothetical protein
MAESSGSVTPPLTVGGATVTNSEVEAHSGQQEGRQWS